MRVVQVFLPMKKIFQVICAFGLRWMLFRVCYALRVRLGFLRRQTPCVMWQDISENFANAQSEKNWLEFWREQRSKIVPDGQASAEAREALTGRFLLFGKHWRALGRFPDWHRSPFDGVSAPSGKHWSEISDFAHGDIKNIWELSRWSWAFALARAWHATRNNAYAERFWELAENWLENNPPNRGANWKCGQESSFRLFAATFARMVLADAPATTPARLVFWRRLVFASGQRIQANIRYALSQSNNHGISESIGLLTAGALTGGAEGRAWWSLGERALRQQLATLVYADGGFSQHSAVYHRVLLHDLLWATMAFRTECAGECPPWLARAGARATRFLASLVDEKTGVAHCYGANDGSNVLPLAECAYGDFRPVVQAASAVFLGAHCFGAGPWDEAAGWLTPAGTRAVPADLPVTLRRCSHFANAGLLLWKSGGLFLMARCPTCFHHRATRDMLHLSVLWHGNPVLLNPGSFSYNPAPDGPFAKGFAGAFTHNTATVGGEDQMCRIGRFLYLPWPRGRVRWVTGGPATTEAEDSHETVFEAVNLAYRKRFKATHTRRFYLREGRSGFVIEDCFEAALALRWRLHWLLADGQLCIDDDGHGWAIYSGNTNAEKILCKVRWESDTPLACTYVRAAAASVRGWYAPHYQDAQPAWSIAQDISPTTHACVRTVFEFTTLPSGTFPSA